jgi:hypothetical protein
METKAKVLFVLFLLITPFQNIFNQNRYLDTTSFFSKYDSFHLKISLNNKTLVGHNMSLAQKLQTLELSNENSLFNSQSYSDFYQNICGINLSQKDEIDNNLIVALQKTLPKEDETITAIRKYLGISKNAFAIILALIHLVKYN